MTESSMQPVLGLLSSINLSKTEEAVIRRFQEDPQGRSFLPVADILRNHNYHQESVEMLMSGIHRHPNFSVARVILARELFKRGLVEESERVLEESPESLHENILAQKLRYKIAVICQKRALFQDLDGFFVHRGLHDKETLELSQLANEKDFATVKDIFLKKLRENGVFIITEEDSLSQNLTDSKKVSTTKSMSSFD